MPSWHQEEETSRQNNNSKERDATLDLLVKHTAATLATDVLRQIKHLKHASKTLTKTYEKHLKTIVKHATSR
jgi:hypothetical protein